LSIISSRSHPGTLLVGPRELASEPSFGSTILIDFSRDRSDYVAAHIPGARYLATDAVFHDTQERLRALRSEAEILSAFGRLGIEPGNALVIYDAGNGSYAARLFVLFEIFGHASVRLLNGGISAWRAAGLPTEDGWIRALPTAYAAPAQPHGIVDSEWIAERIGSRDLLLIDVRSEEEHLGIDRRAERGGHIPGAVNIDWQHNLSDGVSLKQRAELVALYSRLLAPWGVPAPDSEQWAASFPKTLVTYCQSGVRAANTYFVLKYLGFPDVRIYLDSWQVWGNRTELPIAPDPQ
jgi:thiosulfate/3-mercaptopyruvate sulfurtransferase